MKEILPFGDNSITSFPHYASVFTALSGITDETYKMWFIHNFIELQCRFSYNNRIILFDDEFGENNIFNCPLLKKHFLPRDYVQKWGGIIPYIQTQIINKYYVFLSLDQYYNVNFTQYYNKTHFNHTSLIVGFDDNEEAIYVADFYGKYSCKKVSYIDFEKCFSGYDNDKELNGYEYILSAKYDGTESHLYYYRPENIVYLLKKYLAGFKNDNIYFGINAYDVVIEAIDNEVCNPRIVHIIYDHKKAMNLRIKYLRELGLAKILTQELELFDDLEYAGLLCRNLALKVTVKPDNEYKERAINEYKKLYELEMKCINLLLGKLSTV